MSTWALLCYSTQCHGYICEVMENHASQTQKHLAPRSDDRIVEREAMLNVKAKM